MEPSMKEIIAVLARLEYGVRLTEKDIAVLHSLGSALAEIRSELDEHSWGYEKECAA